ncbi:protein eva-1 homolog B isoform X1 [Ictidomys tridecemlineatus]
MVEGLEVLATSAQWWPGGGPCPRPPQRLPVGEPTATPRRPRAPLPFLCGALPPPPGPPRPAPPLSSEETFRRWSIGRAAVAGSQAGRGGWDRTGRDRRAPGVCGRRDPRRTRQGRAARERALTADREAAPGAAWTPPEETWSYSATAWRPTHTSALTPRALASTSCWASALACC